MRDYILHCESPRRYGLGKFALFMPRLIGNGAALHQCTGDFIVAVGSLVDHVPNRLAKRMIACAVELRRLHPDPGHQSILAGPGRRLTIGSKIATALVDEIYRLHLEIMEYDVANAIVNNRYGTIEAVAEVDEGRSRRPCSGLAPIPFNSD